ncbi:MAG: carboxyl transferase domain-containing protein, partial [Acidimicrobiales bacterium]
MSSVVARSVGVSVRAGIDGTVAVGFEEVDGRRIVLARTASDRRRGALGWEDGQSLARAAQLARDARVPLLIELASSGADVSDGLDALHGWGTAAASLATCSGVVPVLSAAVGPVVSGPALLLGLSDLVVMDPSAVAFVSGPSMVEAFTGVRLTPQGLGGVGVHATTTGVCALEAGDAMEAMGELLSFLPDHTDAESPHVPSEDPVGRVTPELRSVVP